MKIKNWAWPIVALTLSVIIAGTIIFIVKSLRPMPGDDISLPNADQMQVPPDFHSATGHDVKG